MEVFWIVVVLGIAAVIWNAIKKQRELEAAKTSYMNSLEELKQHPANPELRQATLAKGRHYSNLTRNKKGVTMFDEVALMNDINAACAGAATFKSSFAEAVSDSIEERLKKLAKLKESNLITEQEYNDKRVAILAEV